MSASNGGIVKLTAAEDVTISSARTAVYANKGKIDIVGKTIDITAGEGAGVRAGTSSSDAVRGNGHVVLGNANTESVTIDGAVDYGIIARAKGNNFKPEEQSSVVVNGKSLVIGGKDGSEVWAGVCAASGTDKSYDDASSTITLNSDYTEINAENGIYNMSNGVVDVKGNLKINASESAIVTRGYAETYINEANSSDITVNVAGDIEFNKFYDSDKVVTNAKVVMNLNNADSVFDGNIIVTNDENVALENLATVSDIIDMNLGLANGAQWNSTADSFVNKLTMNDGVLNVKGTHALSIGELNGTGGEANMQATLNDDAKTAQSGSITVKTPSDATLAVTAMKEDGTAYTADEITVDQIKDVQSRITGVNTTASAPEGDVLGAISIDKNGNVKQAKNSLMEAALNQASVASISLDRILTNDVRKRMGDLRADQNQSGVWMRWDGGKLKGNGLTNDFNTIQIGGDTKVAKNCRLGVAGSFTHGDVDFARGNGELEG
ncbi:MAG: autotransporter domain-containing protein, partial [Mailhella sp.]|nr:autotransporter domain-containing protein [Mailhella sp.]